MEDNWKYPKYRLNTEITYVFDNAFQKGKIVGIYTTNGNIRYLITANEDDIYSCSVLEEDVFDMHAQCMFDGNKLAIVQTLNGMTNILKVYGED